MIDYLTVQRCFGLTPDAVAQTLGTETLAERVARLEAEVEELKKCCKE